MLSTTLLIAAIENFVLFSTFFALVKLRRQTLAGHVGSGRVATHAIASSFVSDSALAFQRRVDRLLTLVDVPIGGPARKIQSSAAKTGAILFAASLVVLSGILLFAPLSVHHATETLIEILR